MEVLYTCPQNKRFITIAAFSGLLLLSVHNQVFPKVVHAVRSAVFQCNSPLKTARTVSMRDFWKNTIAGGENFRSAYSDMYSSTERISTSGE